MTGRTQPTVAVVSGYYGFGNAGDEALLEALIAQWRRRRPDTHFVVLSADPPATAVRHRVEAVHRTDWRAIWRALGRADVFISGGGSLLQDATSPRTVPYYATMMALARMRRVPVVVYAQGLGPLRRPGLRRWAGKALAKAAVVTVRDGASAREAAALGVPLDRIQVVADPVFSLANRRSPAGTKADPAPPASGEGTVVAQLPPGPLVGVSVRPLQGDRSGDGTRRFVDALAADLHLWLGRRGLRMLPMPLHPEQDGMPLRRLVERLGPELAVPWPPGVDPRQLSAHDWLALTARLDLCFTMRLHGLIFAAVAETPFIALADDPKVDAHVAELGLDAANCLVPAARRGTSVSTEAPPDGSGSFGDAGLVAVLERAWRGREQTKALLRAKLPHLADRAEKTVDSAFAAARRRNGSVCVLGTRFHPVTMAEAVAAVTDWVEKDGGAERRPAHIVTANPELVMRARQEEAVRTMLAAADLVVADGIGIVVATRLLGTPVPERVPGVELTEALLEEAARRGWRVYLLGGEPGVAERAAANLREKWPEIRIVGARDGYFGKEEEDAVARQVASAQPDIVFVGMGAPRQELFIAARRVRSAASEAAATDGAAWSHVAVAIGVGGSIDVLAGRVRRAPLLWQRLGLEWLYRLLRQPSRWKRVLALPRFAFLILLRALRRNLL